MDWSTFLISVIVPIITGLSVGLGVAAYKDKRESARRRDDIKRAEKRRLFQMQRESDERQLNAIYEFIRSVREYEEQEREDSFRTRFGDISDLERAQRLLTDYIMSVNRLGKALDLLDLAIINPGVRIVIEKLKEYHREKDRLYDEALDEIVEFMDALLKGKDDPSKGSGLNLVPFDKGLTTFLDALLAVAREQLNRAPSLDDDEFEGMFTPPPAGAPLDRPPK